MKKNYLIAILALVCNFAIAQVQQTSYRGAFAPAPTAMWTNGWTNFDPINAAYSTATRTLVSADITSNVTWTKDKVYELTRLITVRNNATLTIQAGTIIRSNAFASALVITRGAKLIANGTVTEPIVFTSANAAGSRNRGDWGGIVILGKARYNINNGVNYIEGLSQNINTEFGGGLTPDDNDNSGSLKFVRIEFAGFVFAPNNELNGLTLGAVGKGTTIENVQVSYSNDDSFEWLGGSVNCKNLVAFAGLDDDFDVDNGYKGIVQFGLSIKDPLAADISTSEAFEVDNNAAGTDTTSSQPFGDFTSSVFTNITCIGGNARPNGSGGFITPNTLLDKALRLRRASQPKIYNSIFLDFRRGLILESLSSAAAFVADKLIFKNNLIVSPTPFVSTGSGNTTDTSVPNTATVLAKFNASGNTTYTTNTGLLTMSYDMANATNYVGLDYRPVVGGDAATRASFSDSLLSSFLNLTAAPQVTSPQKYCRGSVARVLTANMTATGVSLRWYTKDRTFRPAVGTNPPVQVLDVFTTTAPTPLTSTIGTRSFFVSDVNATGAESTRARIDVETVAAPLVALGTITSVLTATNIPATASVGAYVGPVPAGVTPTQLTYTVPESTEAGITSYLWTVPLGANIISGQGTNSIVVNYANVTSGVLKIGNIGVQAVNGPIGIGCPGVMKTLAITAALPKAPAAVKMTDAALPIPTSGIVPAVTSFARYMGTTIPLTLTATAVPEAGVYNWELPAGVNLLDLGAVQSTTTAFFSVFPFTVPSSRPTAIGNQYYQVISTRYTSGIRIVTASRFVVGGRLPNGVIVAPVGGTMSTATTPVFIPNAVGEPFTEVNGVTVDPAFPSITSISNVITVNFAGVTASNTTNFTSATGISTNVLRIGVRSINGVGVSISSNAAAINPTTTSRAKLLTLTAIRPAAPKVTGQIASLCGGSSYSYTITPSVLASSYDITAPTGSIVTSASMMANATNTLRTSDLMFTVMYPAGFVATVAAPQSLLISAVNGIGTSLLPATVRLSTLVPTVGTITSTTGNITQFNQALTAKVFTVPTNVLYTGYTWTASNGAVITAGQGTNTITVDFSGVVGTLSTTSSIITVVGTNGCTSSAVKSTTLRYNAAALRLSKETVVSATEVYPNPVRSVMNIDVTVSTPSVLDIAIYSLDGTVAVSAKSIALQAGVNAITENVSSLNKGIYIVKLINSSNGEVITKKLIKN